MVESQTPIQLGQRERLSVAELPVRDGAATKAHTDTQRGPYWRVGRPGQDPRDRARRLRRIKSEIVRRKGTDYMLSIHMSKLRLNTGRRKNWQVGKPAEMYSKGLCHCRSRRYRSGPCGGWWVVGTAVVQKKKILSLAIKGPHHHPYGSAAVTSAATVFCSDFY